MRNLIVILALMMAAQGYSKGFPSPSVLFSLSEKIINEASQLIFPAQKEVKQKSKPDVKIKVSPVKTEKTDDFLWNPVEIRRDGMWIVAE